MIKKKYILASDHTWLVCHLAFVVNEDDDLVGAVCAVADDGGLGLVCHHLRHLTHHSLGPNLTIVPSNTPLVVPTSRTMPLLKCCAHKR